MASGIPNNIEGRWYRDGTELTATATQFNQMAITWGANVSTALQVAVGSAGAFVTFNGDAGTPSALVGTNISGTAAGLTAGAASAVTEAGVTGSAWTDFSGSVGFTGFSANPTDLVARYKKIGNTCFVQINMTAGTSNATTFTITGLPFTSAAILQFVPTLRPTDNSAISNTSAWASISTSTTTLIMALGGAASWTASGTKGMNASFA